MPHEDPPPDPTQNDTSRRDEVRTRTSVPSVSVRLPRRRKRASEGEGFLLFILGTVGVAGALALWSLGRIIARAL